MKRSGLMTSVLGSSLLLGGAMFTAPQVTHSAGLWYLAGQVKMALGDTTGGLQLMTRAAKERQHEQGANATAAKPSPAQTQTQTKTCSDRSDAKPAVATAKPKIENAKVQLPAAPQLMTASFSVPASPFAGQDLTALSPEQLKRVTASYGAQAQRWAAKHRDRKIEIAMLQRAAEQSVRARHPQFVRVIVPDPQSTPDFPQPPPVAP